MKYRKHGLKALGLSLLLTLSIMTVTAVCAQAAEWLELVGGVSKKIETNLPFVGEKDSTALALHTTVAGVKLTKSCKNLAVTEGVLKGDGTELAKFSFSQCDVSLKAPKNQANRAMS